MQQVPLWPFLGKKLGNLVDFVFIFCYCLDTYDNKEKYREKDA